MRIHLGHHFYGAGNLGDDFMLAGFLSAMRRHAPAATFTCGVPFALPPLQQRFPTIEWLLCDHGSRSQAISECDVWLGLGGSPFQSARSRWFIDHLTKEAEFCRHAGKPMFFLGVGVQHATDLAPPEVRSLCSQAAGIWTRDAASAERIAALPSPPPVEAAADFAHVFFRAATPPPAVPGRLTLVANFDFDHWPGQDSCLRVLQTLPATDRVWLAQESRDLPGAERALFATLPSAEQSRWRLMSPEIPGAPLPDVVARWPSGEWLVTARYHAALAGAWAGSKVVVLSTNEKLRAVAHELHTPLLLPAADEASVAHALVSAVSPAPPHACAALADAACAAFVRQASCCAKS